MATVPVADGKPVPVRHPVLRWGPPLFVWCVWAGLLLGQLVLVATHAVNMPYWDDWYNVPFLTGAEPLTLEWLWEQTPGTETRTPLYRFLFVALFKLGGDDLRVLPLFNALVLGSVSCGLICTAAQLRGRLSIADAFFPCLLLHGGQAEMVLWNTMIYMTCPLALVGGLLVLLVRLGGVLTLSGAILGGLALVLLSLCGTSGLFFVPFVGLWYAWLGWRAWWGTGTGKRRVAFTVLVVGTATALLTVLFFLGDYQRGLAYEQALADKLQGILRVMAITLGPAGSSLWPVTAWVVPTAAVVAGAGLIRAWSLSPGRRPLVVGLGLILGAALGLAAALGWKRPLDWSFALYYGTLPLLGVCVVYLTGCLVGSTRWQTCLQLSLFGLTAGLLLLNTQEGWVAGAERSKPLVALEEVMEAGTSISALVKRSAGTLLWPALWTEEEEAQLFHQKLFDSLHMLRAAGVGAFRHLEDDPPLQEQRLPLRPFQMHEVTWRNGTVSGEGEQSWLSFALPRPQYVSGIRIRYRHSNSKRGSAYYRYTPGPNPVPYFQIDWKKAGQPDFARGDRYVDVENNVGPEAEQTITLWVQETIDQIRIRPDRRPFVCRIEELVLLVPVSKRVRAD